jgi:hypothetical protein
MDLKNSVQRTLYKEYKELTDEERETAIERKLLSLDSPIAMFWRKNALRIAENRAEYKSKDK